MLVDKNMLEEIVNQMNVKKEQPPSTINTNQLETMIEEIFQWKLK